MRAWLRTAAATWSAGQLHSRGSSTLWATYINRFIRHSYSPPSIPGVTEGNEICVRVTRATDGPTPILGREDYL